ncbi:hypothetical protein RHECIAT_PC0000596 (plasmid) [Rhizobium etli CIAT 652]|uniref:Uncharacterized protein n=1 Tax=Rhizobium etli (strain CIAT 652) TaxID=491916 RepID=B3Q3B7_RHIE6|nr:hypothetical protein RHECIAT_PC0000596 [Rhizobium etli CIAT 652]
MLFPLFLPTEYGGRCWLHDDDVRPSLWPHLLTSPFPPRFRQDLMDGSKGETSPHINENGGAAHQVAAWRTSFLASKAVRLNEFTTRTTLAGVGKGKLLNSLSTTPIGRIFLAARQELTEPAALGKPWRCCF